METKVDLSIITVCYNADKYIADILENIRFLKAKYDFEYIVIDGNSFDGTKTIISSFKDVVDVFVSEPDRGIYHAMNKGVTRARNRYIWLVNSDDFIVLENFHHVAQAVNRSKFDILAFSIEREINGVVNTVSPLKHANKLTASLTTPYKHPGMLVRKSGYAKVGLYDEQMRTASDYDWMLRSLVESLSVSISPVAVTHVRNVGVTSASLGITSPKEVEACLVKYLRSEVLAKAMMLVRFIRKLI